MGAYRKDPLERPDFPLGFLQVPYQVHDAASEEEKDRENDPEKDDVRDDRFTDGGRNGFVVWGVGEGDADSPADVSDAVSLLHVAGQARRFRFQRLHVVEDPVAGGAGQEGEQGADDEEIVPGPRGRVPDGLGRDSLFHALFYQ